MSSCTVKGRGASVIVRPASAVGNGFEANRVNENRACGLTQLVSAASQGDPDSWTEIVNRFTNLLWKVARSHRLNDHDAADVVQSTWLRLLENLPRIDQPEALPGWLTTTARRESLNVLRRHKRDVPVEDPDIQATDDEASELDVGLLAAERDAHLWRCLRQLPQRDQHLLRALVACDKPSYTAVAAALDMPIGSIGPTRMRALKRLHLLLEETESVFRDQ